MSKTPMHTNATTEKLEERLRVIRANAAKRYQAEIDQIARNEAICRRIIAAEPIPSIAADVGLNKQTIYAIGKQYLGV